MRVLILGLTSNVCYLAVILIFIVVTWWLLLVIARYGSFPFLVWTIITRYYAKYARSNESWIWSNDSVWIWKIIIDEIGVVHKSSHSQMFFKISVLKNFTIFTGNFIKRWLQHRCFSVNIAKFLRTVFL